MQLHEKVWGKFKGGKVRPENGHLHYTWLLSWIVPSNGAGLEIHRYLTFSWLNQVVFRNSKKISSGHEGSWCDDVSPCQQLITGSARWRFLCHLTWIHERRKKLQTSGLILKLMSKTCISASLSPKGRVRKWKDWNRYISPNSVIPKAAEELPLTANVPKSLADQDS